MQRLSSDSAGQSSHFAALRNADHRIPEETKASSSQDDRIVAQSRFCNMRPLLTRPLFLLRPFFECTVRRKQVHWIMVVDGASGWNLLAFRCGRHAEIDATFVVGLGRLRNV
jgi:hypothetical protein